VNAKTDTLPVGVLALQGDFELHEQALDRREVPHVRIRRASELDGCSQLIIPGGESTTMTRLIDKTGMRVPILEFARNKPVLGTCAGLILLAREIEEDRARHGVEPLGLLDIQVRRNGFGRQIDSFIDDVEQEGETVQGVFIRAPRILEVGPDVEIIATWQGEPVGVRQGLVTGLCYHPEVV
jgi:pyridoxal 5'-phosphate synthase pdxT subunit